MPHYNAVFPLHCFYVPFPCRGLSGQTKPLDEADYPDASVLFHLSHHGEQQSTLANLPARQQTEIRQLERAAAAYKQEVLDYSLRGEQAIRAAASGRVNTLNAEAGQQVDPALLNEPVYLVRVKPDKATINVYGKEQPLHIGMVVEADILHERKRLYK